ncbi:Leucine-rich repeat, cysteine-containing subtype containing protein [Dorcoceras hygrometricum]|uniref:Leucine-rich repeat, cysteine-containing subtype containing protein n=1 Tax=Dorcoceras hygrometricum TaxID=472368 RepID=A0A2Z7BWK7_9LAMI|nr:Leucine-rich repeat, cysteine-containing subtype containing protein [Dorcoceras hygrometricum]
MTSFRLPLRTTRSFTRGSDLNTQILFKSEKPVYSNHEPNRYTRLLQFTCTGRFFPKPNTNGSRDTNPPSAHVLSFSLSDQSAQSCFIPKQIAPTPFHNNLKIIDQIDSYSLSLQLWAPPLLNLPTSKADIHEQL